MFSLYQTLSLRYLLKHRLRTALVILSIALGVGTWVATELLHATLSKSIRSANMPLPGVADYYVVNNTVRSVDAKLAERLQKVQGVQHVQTLVIEPIKVQPGEAKADVDKPVSATILGIGIPGGSNNSSRQQVVADLKQWGIEIDENELNAFFFQLALSRVPLSRFPPPALVGQKLDEQVLQNAPKFQVTAGGKPHTMLRVGTVRATGAASSLGGYVVVTDAETAATMLGMKGRASRIDVVLEPGVNREQVEAEMNRALADSGADLQSPQTQDQRIQDVVRGVEVGFRLCGAGALVVGMFLVFNALSVSVAERRHDIGIMRSVGATRGQVRMLFLCEALVMGLVGTLLGLPLGVGLANASLGPIQEILKGIILPVDSAQVELPIGPFVRAFFAGMGTAFLAALIPASQAAAEEPADAVRRVPQTALLLYRILHIGSSLLLLVAGLLAVAIKPYLAPDALHSLSPSMKVEEITYLGWGCILVGSLLLTPVLAAWLTRALQPVMRVILPVESRLAMDNLVRVPGRTGLVIGALASCIALMIQTAGNISSSETGFTTWLDQTMQADLFVTTGGPISAGNEMNTMDAQVGKDLKKDHAEVEHVVGNCYRMVDWEGVSGETKVFLVITDALAHYKANQTRWSDKTQLEYYSHLGTEKGTAIVSENFALQQKKKVGDTITLKGGNGLIDLRIIGVVVDYSWNRGTIIVDRQSQMDTLRASRADSYEVYCKPGTDVNATRDKIQQSEMGSRHSLFVVTREELRAHLLQLIRRLYGVQYPQEILVGMVAVLGVVMSLLISVLSRRRELGLLRAVGGTRLQLLHTVLAEAVLIGVVGTLLGILLGVPLEWYVVRVILFEEAGFLFPMQFPWLATLVIALLAVVCSTIAGLGPAIQAMHLRITDAIAYE